MKKEKAFTLIELIVVLVILAIIALIVTPIVLNIIDKAKISANKRSIDAYGKSIELAMSSYKLEHGKFTYDINDLKIEYSGNKVECDDITLNENGSVFITKCKIDGEYIEDEKTDDGYYQYGKIVFDYKIGDIITYNGIDFFVIENSKKSTNSVTLLKTEPLSVDEVNTYGAGHINEYANSQSTRGAAYNYNGYGGMVYYSSNTCGYINGSYIKTDCTIDYNKSEIKYVVDAWAKDKLDINSLVTDKFGYKARLITYDELTENLEYANIDSSRINVIASKSYSDLMYGSYWYWTMSPYQDYDNMLWFVTSGHLASANVSIQGAAVRPVINLKKSAIEE